MSDFVFTPEELPETVQKILDVIGSAGVENKVEIYKFMSDLFTYSVVVFNDPAPISELWKAETDYISTHGHSLVDPIEALRLFCKVVIKYADIIELEPSDEVQGD